MIFSYKPLELIESKSIGIPEQKISSKPWRNKIINFIFSKLEKILLDIDRNINVSEIIFHSPVKTRFPENNLLKVRHYKSDSQIGCAIIILPQKGAGYNFAQLMALYLANNGIDAYELETPLKGSRLPKNYGSINKIRLEINDLRILIKQGVTEIRSLVDIIDKEKIGICGISLGTIYSSIAYDVDERISSACLILGGGDLAGILLNSNDKFTRQFRIRKNISEGELRERLADIEPCNYTSLDKAKNLLMINATYDKDVPNEYGKKLNDAWGNPKLYLIKAGHVSIVKDICKLMPRVLEHYEKTLRISMNGK